MQTKNQVRFVGIFCLIVATLSFQNCGQDGSQYVLSEFQSLSGNSAGELSSEQNAILKSSTPVAKTTLLANLKSKSCMFNALLFPAIEDEVNYHSLLKRSGCASLPRAVETWNNPPNFSVIKSKIQNIEMTTGRRFTYGMFIAESIAFKSVYLDELGKPFNFVEMCESGSIGRWGEGTCVPTTASAEYKRYLRHIVKLGLETGITDFLFGQADYQDGARVLPQLVEEFRQLARTKAKEAIFGVQPNSIPSESYLKVFDYIISPLFVDRDISRTCASGSTSSYCIVVWYHQDLLAKSNLVIAELDWSSADDDIHRFARKSQIDRSNFLADSKRLLESRGAGLILPFRIPLNEGSQNNCFGVNQWVYSSSNLYGCKDETAINSLLQNQGTKTSTPQLPLVIEYTGHGLILNTNQFVETQNLRMYQQSDGNLVIYRKVDNVPLWASKVSGKNCSAVNCHTIFQMDGNLVQYQGTAPYWAAASNGATKLVFQESVPYLRAVNSSGVVLWSSK